MQVHPEVAAALADGRPVVALESTIISHGLPRPDNLGIAREIEQAVRDGGAVPATIAVVAGQPRIGLDDAALRDDRRVRRGGQGQRPGPGHPRRAPGHRRHHGGLDGAPGRPGRHRGVRHRRPGRRAPAGPRLLGRVGRPGHAVPDADHRRLRRGEVDPGRGRHPGAAGDAERRRARLPDRRLPRLLPRRLRAPAGLAGGLGRRGGRGDAGPGGARHRPVRPGGGQPDPGRRRAGPRPARPGAGRRAGRAQPGRGDRQAGDPVPAGLLPPRDRRRLADSQRPAGAQQRPGRRRDRGGLRGYRPAASRQRAGALPGEAAGPLGRAAGWCASATCCSTSARCCPGRWCPAPTPRRRSATCTAARRPTPRPGWPASACRACSPAGWATMPSAGRRSPRCAATACTPGSRPTRSPRPAPAWC